MKKNILLFVFLLAAGMVAQAQNYVLIDMEYILKNIPAYQKANDQLTQSSKKWQAEVDKLSQEAKRLYESYQASKNLSSEQMTRKENEIVEKEKAASELRRKYFGPEGEMVKLQDELMTPIQDAIYEAVKEVATRHGYDLVIDRASATGVIFASPAIDVSDDVLDRMGID